MRRELTRESQDDSSSQEVPGTDEQISATEPSRSSAGDAAPDPTLEAARRYWRLWQSNWRPPYNDIRRAAAEAMAAETAAARGAAEAPVPPPSPQTAEEIAAAADFDANPLEPDSGFGLGGRLGASAKPPPPTTPAQEDGADVSADPMSTSPAAPKGANPEAYRRDVEQAGDAATSTPVADGRSRSGPRDPSPPAAEATLSARGRRQDVQIGGSSAGDAAEGDGP